MIQNTEAWVVGGMFAAVSIASLIGYALKGRQPNNAAIENLNARIRSWWMITVVCGGALLAGRIAIILLFVLVSAQALHEFLTHAPARRAGRFAPFVCFFLLLPVQYLLIGVGWYGLFCVWIPVFGLLVLAVADSTFYWGLMVCVYCVSHIPALLILKIPGYENRTPLLIVFLVLIAQVSDILQYVWGKLIGRHPLLPRISPSKTIEGLVGGVLSATVFGALLRPITPFTVWQASLMAFLIAMLGAFGGMVMSAIKRDRGIKDWGRSIPGHGGVLDRIDSLCFSAPVFFHLTRYFFA